MIIKIFNTMQQFCAGLAIILSCMHNRDLPNVDHALPAVIERNNRHTSM